MSIQSQSNGGTGSDAPHGLVWHRSTDGQRVLPCPLPAHELRRRLDEYYYPYHRAIRRLMDARRREFGYSILLCAHSMPSRGRHGSADVGRKRADIVPGSRGRTTAAAEVIDATEAVAKRSGWTVAHDDPYRGGFTTMHYGQPHQGWHALRNRTLQSAVYGRGFPSASFGICSGAGILSQSGVGFECTRTKSNDDYLSSRVSSQWAAYPAASEPLSNRQCNCLGLLELFGLPS